MPNCGYKTDFYLRSSVLYTMARGSSRRIRQILFFLAAFVSYAIAENQFPVFESLTVLNSKEIEHDNVPYREVEFLVQGKNIYSGMQIVTTRSAASKNTSCTENLTNYNVSEIRTFMTETHYTIRYPKADSDNVYFCLPYLSDYFHQGERIFVNNSSSLTRNRNDVIQPNIL